MDEGVEFEKDRFLETIKREKLIPDTGNPGKFLKLDDHQKNKSGFLSPENWVFHEGIVRKVMEGDYEGITPYSAEFVPTLNCTNRCIGPCSYCLQRMNEGIADKNDFKNPRIHMQSAVFAMDLVDRLADGGIKGITFTGGGEPSLFKGLEETMEHVSERGINMVLYTNGNSWSSERIRRVAKTNPLLVRLSLNCGTKEGYNKFHRPFNQDNTFKTVLNSIACFAREARDNPAMNFGVSFILNQTNYKEIPETAKILRQIVLKTKGRISFVTYRPSFNYCGSLQTSPEIVDAAYYLVENEARQILEDINIRVNNVKCRYDSVKGEERGYEICRATGLFLELSPSGELHSCCDRNCFKPYKIGDLRANTIKEIFSGSLRKSVMSYANDYQCTTCPIACKPHEINKQFEKIERLRVEREFYKVKIWIDALRSGPVPRMVNF